ncbi:MAG: hypothetical protein JHD23_11395 [Akkermansiaceae bacterium]|nr:hypothetical protein [Akkermansiaceae bacterium]MBJ7425084.1 hypothetical protein [Akkermansiaceae bacterium]
MKFLPLISLLGLVLLAISCRTLTPLDPMTMKPSARCLPASLDTEVETSVNHSK